MKQNTCPSKMLPYVEVIAELPHDGGAYTQGLLVVKRGEEKFFIESTGQYGGSTIRKVDIDTGKVLAKYDLPEEYWGEGVTLGPNGEFVLITYKTRKGFIFRLEENGIFTLVRTFPFESTTGEGWGIDSNGKHLFVSNGSSTILVWDAETMQEVRRFDVTYLGYQINRMNELEYANGYLYANLWPHSDIAKIDPRTGEMVTIFDCSALSSGLAPDEVDARKVMNGIAYDEDEDVFYLTGKLWKRMYKVRFHDRFTVNELME